MNRHNHGRGLAASILVALLGVSLLPTSAFAGSLSTASAFLRPGTQYLGDSAGQVFQLRVRNSGSGAPIGAVRITRPSLLWTVTACPTGPAGWTRTAAADSCEYTSSPGDADDIPAGSARSFRLKATTGGASHNVWGTWAVTVSSGDDLTVPGNNAPASPMPMGLRTRAFSFQIVDAVISTSSAAVGSACPSPEKSAIAGSSASFLIICGRNRTNAAQTTLNQNSKLLGTMFTAHGSFTGGSVPSSSDVVVLGYWNSVQVNANPGSGKAVRLRVGSAFNATSPVTRIAGFIAIGGPSGDTATVANNDSYNTNEDTQLVVAASGVLGNDTDPDSGALHSLKVTDPSNGSVTMNSDGSFQYTPNDNYNGPDSFTYQSGQSSPDSNIATVNITVVAVSDPTVANNDSYSTNEDTTLTVLVPGVVVNDSDPDSGALHSLKITDPSHGSVTMNSDGSFQYVPANNFNGPDSFTYQSGQSSPDSNIATVNITVNAVNDAPTATGDAFSLNENTTASFPVAGVLDDAADVDGDSLQAILVTGPAHHVGTFTLNTNGTFSYQPTSNYTGPDSFTWKAKDPSGAESSVVTVNITVNDTGSPGGGGGCLISC